MKVLKGNSYLKWIGVQKIACKIGTTDILLRTDF